MEGTPTPTPHSCCTAQEEGVAAGTGPVQLALHSSSFSNQWL